MTKQELKKGAKAWCWWKSRTLYYTGREWDKKGYNTKTQDYTPEHQYEFEDIYGARFSLTEEQVAKLQIK